MTCTPKRKVPRPMYPLLYSSIMQTLSPNIPVNLSSSSTNNKAELLIWNYNSKDGIFFRELYAFHQFEGKTAVQLRAKYHLQFGKYANKTINSAFQNL
eukprot:14078034-Ditylum_brightwellii.AAC.1